MYLVRCRIETLLRITYRSMLLIRRSNNTCILQWNLPSIWMMSCIRRPCCWTVRDGSPTPNDAPAIGARLLGGAIPYTVNHLHTCSSRISPSTPTRASLIAFVSRMQRRRPQQQQQQPWYGGHLPQLQKSSSARAETFAGQPADAAFGSTADQRPFTAGRPHRTRLARWPPTTSTTVRIVKFSGCPHEAYNIETSAYQDQTRRYNELVLLWATDAEHVGRLLFYVIRVNYNERNLRRHRRPSRCVRACYNGLAYRTRHHFGPCACEPQ